MRTTYLSAYLIGYMQRLDYEDATAEGLADVIHEAGYTTISREQIIAAMNDTDYITQGFVYAAS